MTFRLHPVQDRIVILPEEPAELLPSGLYMPQNAMDPPTQGKVMEVGPGVKQENGERIPVDVKIGDVVLFHRHAGTPAAVDGIEYVIMAERDIYAILDPPAKVPPRATRRRTAKTSAKRGKR